MGFFDDFLEEGKKAIASFQNDASNALSPSVQDNNGLPSVPWENQKDVFFEKTSIAGENWNKFFPYRLLVIDSRTNKAIGRGETAFKTKVDRAEDSTTVTVEPMGNKWVYNFPISPSQLSISDPFAIRVSSTLQGILEEHNGPRFKLINIQGTTGVWPNRPNAVTPPNPTGTIAGTIFSNSINALAGVVDSVNRIKNIAGGDHPASKPKAPKPEGALQEQTGYYQAMLLGQFLEQYAVAKKDPKNKHWRLVFDMPKRNQSYVVTPINYSSNQNKEKPTEYLYSLQLKGWKKVEVDAALEVPNPEPVELEANTYLRVVGSINEARRLIGKNLDLIKAVRSDFQKFLNVFRQAVLFCKDAAGLITAVVDLPRQVVKDFEFFVKESLDIIFDFL